MEEDLFLVEMKMSGRCGHRNWWYAGTAQDVCSKNPCCRHIMHYTHEALLEDQGGKYKSHTTTLWVSLHHR